MMQDILEEEAASDDPREARVRFAIRAMTNCSDPRGLAVLARHQNLLAVDPRTIADYIRALTITDARHGEPFFEVLDQPARDRNDGVIAHVLRALDCRGWGHAEGDRFDRIARDSARRTYVRGWALQGFSRCPQWRPDDVVDLVRSRDAHPRLVRAGGLAIRHVPESRARTQMLRLMSTAKPELVPTAEWIASAP
jgi:hypothetical protein